MKHFANKPLWIPLSLTALALILNPLPGFANPEEKVISQSETHETHRRLPPLPTLPQSRDRASAANNSRPLCPVPRVDLPPARTIILPKANRKTISRQNSISNSSSSSNSGSNERRSSGNPPQSTANRLRTVPARAVSGQNTQNTQNTRNAQNTLAQGSTVVRRRYLTPPWSYVALGGNIGLSSNGLTDLGKGSVALDAKIALSNNISVRPAALFGDRATFLLPVTYDLSIQTGDPFEPPIVYPFIGGGIAFANNNEALTNNVAPLVAAGVDLRVSDRVVFYTNVSAGFFREQTEVGARLGIGYVFSEL